MQVPGQTAVGAGALPKALIFGQDDEISTKKPDRIGPVLDKAASALVNSQLIGCVARRTRIIDSLDRAMCEQQGHHVAGASQPVEAGEQVLPLLVGLNVTPAVGNAFDRIPAARSAGGVPHQRLDHVDAIEYDRAVVVLLAPESGNGIDDVVVARERAEGFDLKASRAARVTRSG